MAQLRDTSPVVAAILDGEYDDVLPHIVRAAEWRTKSKVRTSGFRPNARVRVTEAALDRAPEMVGRIGKIERVNAKSLTVELDPLDEHDFRTGWRMPHAWLEVIPAGERSELDGLDRR